MAAGGDIEHSGRVQRVGEGRVWVAIVANSACEGCRARKACGVSESAEKIVEVETSAASSFAAGEEVIVAVRRKAGLRAVVFAYVLPLAVLILLLAGAKLFGAEDGPAALISLTGVALYYAVLRLLRSAMSERIRFTVRKI